MSKQLSYLKKTKRLARTQTQGRQCLC